MPRVYKLVTVKTALSTEHKGKRTGAELTKWCRWLPDGFEIDSNKAATPGPLVPVYDPAPGIERYYRPSLQYVLRSST